MKLNMIASVQKRIADLRMPWALSPITMIALTIVFVLIAYNATFWSIAVDVFSGHPISFVGYIIALYFLTLGAFSLFGFPWVVKPFLIFIVILSSITSYYMDTLGVIIDRDMIQNVMVTTITESKHLITLGFVTHVVIYGIVPALVLSRIKVKKHRKLYTVLAPVLMFVVGMALAVGFLMADLKSYSSILRERKDFMSSYQPGAPLVGAIRYVKMISSTVTTEFTPIGQDAAKGASYAGESRKPMLTIIAVGETARTQNFSLNGYERETNPSLAKLPIVSFSDVNSCGTATAVSLPCMFSRFGRDAYSYERGVSYGNLVDVLSQAGLHVEWWDNNTGHKQIADRIETRSYTHTKNEEFCSAGECMDGIFLKALEDYAATIKEDTVLVLHQIGSHGPTYYLRYPDEFERFTPACRTAEFKKCTPEEITNSYDNTIVYTDEILTQIIKRLEAQDHLTTSMLYVSDHGESLGENGLFLHGAPYFLAPETQTKVPMILWMSQEFQDNFGIRQDCLEAQKDDTLSHDNLFHSLLGMLDIQTSERKPELDIFAKCKTDRKAKSS